jgi:hypothetical protein
VSNIARMYEFVSVLDGQSVDENSLRRVRKTDKDAGKYSRKTSASCDT